MTLFSGRLHRLLYGRKKQPEPLPIDLPCCDVCGDDGSIYIHSNCHPKDATWAVVSGATLTVECSVCGEVVERFRIAGVVK